MSAATATNRVVFESEQYVACLTSAGISVQDKAKGNGRVMRPDHPQFKSWSRAWDDLYTDETDIGIRLCRELLR